MLTATGNDDLSWDGIFDSRGRLPADGYVVEAPIPFKPLRFRSGPGARWGIQIERRIAEGRANVVARHLP